MEKDKLVLIPEMPVPSGWKSVSVSIELYEVLKNMADELRMPMSKVACLILEYGIERE